MLLQQIQRLMSSYANTDLASIDVGQAMVEITEVVRSQGLALPPSITMHGRGLVTLEGVVAESRPAPTWWVSSASTSEKQVANIASLSGKLKEALSNSAMSAQAATPPAQAAERHP